MEIIASAGELDGWEAGLAQWNGPMCLLWNKPLPPPQCKQRIMKGQQSLHIVYCQRQNLGMLSICTVYMQTDAFVSQPACWPRIRPTKGMCSWDSRGCLRNKVIIEPTFCFVGRSKCRTRFFKILIFLITLPILLTYFTFRMTANYRKGKEHFVWWYFRRLNSL